MPTTSNVSTPRAAVAITVVAALATLLGVYQWLELVQLRTAGGTPLCSFSATFDCAGVWNSPLAHAVHQSTGLPIAGWGLAWSLIVLILGARLWLRVKQPAGKSALTEQGYLTLALRLTTGIGVAVALLLLVYSAVIKVFCPTCILFYLFVAITAYLAFARLTTQSKDWVQPSLLSGGLLLISFAVLLYPGLHTPRENIITAKLSNVSDQPKVSPAPTSTASDLEQFLNSLPFGVKQATSDTLAMYRKAPLVKTSIDPKRLTFGTANTPVHIIEWTDIRCPHCKNLEAALTEIRDISPPNSWSQETRHFPLDSECNSKVERTSGGISCLAAKLEICLVGSPDFNRVRSAMFQEQANLTKERIWEIATKDADRRKNLEDCVNSPATAAALKEDIELADKYQIDGTPLVVIEGRKAAPVPALILGLIMAKGHDDDPGFLVLPSPNLGPVSP